MKKILLTFVVVIAFATSIFAQDLAFEKGDNLVNIGIGINSYFGGGIPISLSYEKGITNDISLGGGLDYVSRTYPNIYGFGSYSLSAFYIGGRGAYHFNRLLKKADLYSPKLDIYAGLTLGYVIYYYSENYLNYFNRYNNGLNYAYYGTPLFLGVYAGGKYYITPKINVLLELGLASATNARIGIGFKF